MCYCEPRLSVYQNRKQCLVCDLAFARIYWTVPEKLKYSMDCCTRVFLGFLKLKYSMSICTRIFLM